MRGLNGKVFVSPNEEILSRLVMAFKPPPPIVSFSPTPFFKNSNEVHITHAITEHYRV